MKISRAEIIIIIAFVLALLSGGKVRAQTRSMTPVAPIGDPTCVATMSGQCLLRSPNNSVVLMLNGDDLTAVMKTSEPVISQVDELIEGVTAQREKTFSIQDDLEIRVSNNEISSEDAQEILADLEDNDGTLYTIPTFIELVDALGFPREAISQDTDLRELVRAHLQLTLGIGHLTAGYISDRLGIERVRIEFKPKPTVEEPTLSARDEEAPLPSEDEINANRN